MPSSDVINFFDAVVAGKIDIEANQQSCTQSPETLVRLAAHFGYPFTVEELQAEVDQHLKKPHVLRLFAQAHQDPSLEALLKSATHPETLDLALQSCGHQLTKDELHAVIYACCHCTQGLFCQCRAGGVGQQAYESSGSLPQEPVECPTLEEEKPLTPDQIDHFRQQGHVRVSGALSQAEANIYRPALLQAVHRLDRERQEMEQTVGGQSRGWMFVDNVWRHDPAAETFVLAKRFGKLAADLLGVDVVRLFRDQSYFKKPGGGNTPWHQDAYFMPLDTEQVITMWLALSPVSKEMAPMWFVSQSHKQGYLGTSTPEQLSMNAFHKAMEYRGMPVMTYGALDAGDATFHSGWTLHSSRSNTSDRTREAMVIVYYADGAKVHMPDPGERKFPQEEHAAEIRQTNLENCLPGLKPGDLAVTDMNPIVYQRSSKN